MAEPFEYEGVINVRPAWGMIELEDGEKLDSAIASRFAVDDGAPWKAKVKITIELEGAAEQMGFGGLVPCVPDGGGRQDQ